MLAVAPPGVCTLYLIVPPDVTSRRPVISGCPMLIVNSRIHMPEAEFELSFVRSSGPGGQNVNKVNSKAVLRWNVAASSSLPADVRQRFLERYARRITGEGELVLTSQRFRDQGRNTIDVLEKL